ncbi:MAG: hypothetical protein IKV43_00730, partial [Clostridia bacterium]|nr:hypothetical protein [Clostridia bacterium]
GPYNAGEHSSPLRVQILLLTVSSVKRRQQATALQNKASPSEEVEAYRESAEDRRLSLSQVP